MKIAVCGSGSGSNKEISEKAKEIGREIIKSGNILLTGGGTGYPYASVRGAILENGKVICYSPANNKEEHTNIYGFPFEESAQYIYTNLGIPGRNLPLVQNADAIIIVGGQIGTLNEFTIAFARDKKIGILEGSGELIKLLPPIVKVCDNSKEAERIFYDTDAKKLIEKISFNPKNCSI